MSEVVFSVIVPCFNQADFLPDAINSILNQSYGSWEIIIVNDGSVDNTQELTEMYLAKDNRIRVVNQNNRGLSAARNSGIKQSKGNYLIFLDSDDWLYLDYLKVAHDYFQNDIDILISGYAHWKMGVSIHEVSRPSSNLGIDNFIYGNYAPPVAFVIKKTIIEKIGLFDENLKSSEDWDFWIRAAKCRLKIVSIPQVLAAYRYSDQSMSRDGGRMYQALKEVFQRIPQIDPRIKSSNQILPSDIDISRGILGALMPCIGVILIQGRVDEAVTLYRSEQMVFDLKPTKSDFMKLNSYLTFRYWNTKVELERVFKDFQPIIEEFLRRILLPEVTVHEISILIFRSSIKKMNHIRYGSFIGKIINKMS